MTDISKCHGQDCTIKHDCYRYTAPAESRYQAYSNFETVCLGTDMTHEYFWPNNNKAKTIDGNFKLLEK
jgi:hypothetical protein